MCECDCECRPLGFLLGLPFALLAFLVSIVGVLVWIVGPLGFLLGLPFALLAFIVSLVGVLVWIVGILLSCICPCCICVTLLVEFALELIKAPLHVMEWFTSQIPC